VRLLIVEKDETLNELIRKSLNEAGYKTDEAFTIKDAKYFLDIRHYNLIIIDTNFGLSEVYKFIDYAKEVYPLIKVLVISDDESVESEIKTLKMGADDYIKKPLNFDLLIARVNVALRSGKESQIKIKDLIIVKDEEKIIYKGKESYLKGKAFEVFMHLARYPNQVISKEQLLDAIWEEPELVTPNVIEVAINQIRQRLTKFLKLIQLKPFAEEAINFVIQRSSMSLKITEECIACDACVDECPNGAIEPGDPIYEIDPDLCTECIEYGGEPQCVQVCPVDAIVPDPDNIESAKELKLKAELLHKEEE